MAVTTYLTVNGKIRSEQRSGESGSRDYVHDGSGNVVGIYRNGWLQADASYDPYGELYTQWNMGNGGYRFTWGGAWGYRQTFTEYSSVYVRARHYSRAVGSWLSVAIPTFKISDVKGSFTLKAKAEFSVCAEKRGNELCN